MGGEGAGPVRARPVAMATPGVLADILTNLFRTG